MSDLKQVAADPDYIYYNSDPSGPYLFGSHDTFRSVVHATSSGAVVTWESKKEQEDNTDYSSTKSLFGNEERENVLIDQVESLKQIKNNWDTHGAEAPNQTILWNSRIILEMLFHLDLFPNDIVPSAEGGVGIVFKKDERYADIELFNDGDIIVTMSKKDGNPLVKEVETITHQEIEGVRRFLNP
jgi:hypothetical protein